MIIINSNQGEKSFDGIAVNLLGYIYPHSHRHRALTFSIYI